VEYENLLVKFGTDYRTVNHKNVDAAMIGSFYGAGGFERATFPNAQVFDSAGLRGRLLSSPTRRRLAIPGTFPCSMRLNELFQKHQADGTVSLDLRHAGLLRPTHELTETSAKRWCSSLAAAVPPYQSPFDKRP